MTSASSHDDASHRRDEEPPPPSGTTEPPLPSQSQPSQQPSQQPQRHETAAALACDDAGGSYFDSEWVSGAVHSAVAHFFGGAEEEEDDDDDDSAGGDKGNVRNKEGAAGGEGASKCNGTAPDEPPTTSSTRENFNCGASSAPALDLDANANDAGADDNASRSDNDDDNDIDVTTKEGPSTGSISSGNAHLAVQTPHSTTGRARSLAPTTASFHTACGLDQLALPQCESAPGCVEEGNDDDGEVLAAEALGALRVGSDDGAESNTMSSVTERVGAGEDDHYTATGAVQPASVGDIATATAAPNDNDYQPHFVPADYAPATWLAALTPRLDHPPLAYCGAGTAASALAAALVVHPLAVAGAAVAGAAGGAALWAVGFFGEAGGNDGGGGGEASSEVALGGYRIWRHEEFGRLFWEDATEEAREGENGVENGMEGGRTALLLEEGARMTISGGTAAAAALDGDLKTDRGGTSATTGAAATTPPKGKSGIAVDAGEPQLSTSAREPPRTPHPPEPKQRQRPPQSKKGGGGYALRRIKSAPVRAGRRSSKSSADEGRTAVSTIPSAARPTRTSPSTTASTSSSETAVATPAIPSSSLDAHFPPLDVCVVRNVRLPGLAPSEFFDVFFADDAPYSLRDFQKRRGDADIAYGEWEECRDGGEEGGAGADREGGRLRSFKSGRGCASAAPLPPGTTRQRTLRFNTLTKSYFGPAYAKAAKVQRATRFSDRTLVIENVTQLADIPFSDRFRVMERWVVEAAEHGATERRATTSDAASDDGTGAAIGEQRHVPPPGTDDGAGCSASCRLTVHAEVQMLKPCSWEAQIKKKARETFTEVLNEWCRSATTALRATEEQKRRRRMLQREGEEDGGAGRYERRGVIGNGPESNDGAPNEPLHPASVGESELFYRHQRNFREIDRLVASGDLDLSVEVVHSLRAGRGSAFARVLENGECAVRLSADNDEDLGGADGSRRMSAKVIMRGKGQKLFKKLSSRVSKPRPR